MRRALKWLWDSAVLPYTTPLRAVVSVPLFGYILVTIAFDNWLAFAGGMAAWVIWNALLTLIAEWGHDVASYEHDIAVRERAIVSLLEHAQLRREGF